MHMHVYTHVYVHAYVTRKAERPEKVWPKGLSFQPPEASAPPCLVSGPMIPAGLAHFPGAEYDP